MTDQPHVIDASSVLAFLFDEPGADIVTAIARNGRLLISSINLAEVLAKLADRGIAVETGVALLAPLALEIIGFDLPHALQSARLRCAAPQSAGLSLGERCCLTLALAEGVPVLTADRKWLGIAEAIGAAIVITRPNFAPQPH